MHRREFLIAAGLAPWPLAGFRLPRWLTDAGLVRPLGLHLGSLQGLLADRFEETLEAVQAIGFRELEFAGYHGRLPEETRPVLSRLRLTAPAAHLPLSALEDDAVPTFQAAQRMGHDYLVAQPVAPPRPRPDAWMALANRFNAVGYAVRVAGFRFACHTGAAELDAVGEVTGLELLLEHTDPDLVDFELTLGARLPDPTPLDLLTRFPRRFPLLHVLATAAPTEAAPEAEADLAAALGAAEEAGLRHLFVRPDPSPDPLAAALAGYRTLRHLRL